MQIKQKIGIDYSKDQIIESVIKAEYYPAKSLNENEFNNQFAKQLSIVIDAYFGATNGTSIVTIQECAEIFKERYFNLGIDEIKMAARYSVDNQLENKTYFGQFTCALFVEMMNKYISHRLTIRNALKNALNEKSLIEKEIEMQNQKKLEFEKLAEEWMQDRLLNDDLKEYNEIPFGIANYFSKKIEFSEEINTISIEYAKKELQKERNERFYSGDKMKADQIYRMLNSNDNNYLLTHAKTIYMRLIVMDYIKKNIILPNDLENNIQEESPKF